MHWWPRKDNSFQQSNYLSCSKRSSERQILLHLPRTVIPSVVLDNCGIVSFCFEDITSTVLVVINIRYENSTKYILALCWIDVNTVIQFKFYHLEKNRSCSPLFIKPTHIICFIHVLQPVNILWSFLAHVVLFE